MSDSWVAGSDAWSLFYNPAGIITPRTEASLWYNNRYGISEFSYGAVALAVPVKRGAFGLGVHTFGFADFRESRISGAYAQQLTDDFSAGVQLNLNQFSFGDEVYGSVVRATADVGIRYRLSDYVTAGAAVQNIGRTALVPALGEQLSTLMRFGVIWQPGDNLLVTADVVKDIDLPMSLRAGLEYRPVKALYLRAGASSNPGGFSAGVGVWMGNFRLDIATQYQNLPGLSPHVSLTYAPGK